MERLYRADDGAFVVCPYCRAPLTEATEALRLEAFRSGAVGPETDPAPVRCTVCALDVTCDAPSEVYAVDERAVVGCRHCADAIVADAVYCHYCKMWQTEPFVR